MLNPVDTPPHSTEVFVETAPPDPFYRRHEHFILAAAGLVTFASVWELLPALGLVHPLFTSSPSRIFMAAKWLFAHGLWADIAISGTEFGIGFLLAVLVGVPLGVLFGWYDRLRAPFDPLISMLYVTPRVALIPLLILWLGIRLTSKIAVVFLGAIFPILSTSSQVCEQSMKRS